MDQDGVWRHPEFFQAQALLGQREALRRSLGVHGPALQRLQQLVQAGRLGLGKAVALDLEVLGPHFAQVHLQHALVRVEGRPFHLQPRPAHQAAAENEGVQAPSQAHGIVGGPGLDLEVLQEVPAQPGPRLRPRHLHPPRSMG